MFCTKCGHELIENSKFCTKCGNPATNFSNHDGNQKEPDYKNKFKIGKYFFRFSITSIIISVVLCILIGLFSNGSTVTGTGVNQVSTGGIIVTLINWLLAIIGLFAVILLILGIILGIIYSVKAGEESGEKGKYFRRVSIWWFSAPITLIVANIFIYVLINVISNLTTH